MKMASIELVVYPASPNLRAFILIVYAIIVLRYISRLYLKKRFQNTFFLINSYALATAESLPCFMHFLIRRRISTITVMTVRKAASRIRDMILFWSGFVDVYPAFLSD